MEIAIPLFDRFTALDAIGPYQVLSMLPGANVRFLAAEAGPVRTDNGMLTVLAEGRYEDVPEPEVLVAPGGPGTRAMLSDERLLDWIRSAHGSSRYTTSVCTGSLLLAAAGLLDGLDAATHWLSRDELAELGARAVPERVVERGKLITAAGVSAGIDMGLRLAELLAGAEAAQAVQLIIEYDPEPPFDAGSPEKASPEVVEWVRDGRRPKAAPAT
ncbi:MAG: DJ-1/PfpI family protein [Actinomycetota bacterium]|nr:DJ-1/PfpI family protein [Actinomycetota bacterium]